MPCALCKVRDEEHYRTIYKDELFFIIFNKKPIHEMHVMILPVRHIEHWGELTAEESIAMLALFDKCMTFFEIQTGQGVNCVINSQKFRSQNHLHAHIIPNHHGSGRYAEGFLRSGDRCLADPSVQEKLAMKLKKLFA